MQKTYTAQLKKQSHASKVLIAVSGGTDSAVAAALLKTQGFELHGIFFQMVESCDRPFQGYCSRCASHTPETARKVCEKLDLSFHCQDSQGIYQAEVIDHLVHESLQQRAPRACFKCNQEIIFRGLIQQADKLGCSHIATGHYAQIVQDTVSEQAVLSKAADSAQDQSHLLYGLSQDVLRRCIFPLGTLSQSMVDKLAQEVGVEAHRPANSSPGPSLCFSSKRTFSAYVEDHSAPVFRPHGVIRTQQGEIVGEHTGLHQFTIGQPGGNSGQTDQGEIKLSIKNADQYCVSGFDLVNHALIVAEKSLLSSQVLIASDARWIRKVSQIRPFRCQARVLGSSAHGGANEANCRVTVYENSTLQIELDEPFNAISPGQVIVFYDASEVLGGAVIERSVPVDSSTSPVADPLAHPMKGPPSK